jgi:hypothetical protein
VNPWAVRCESCLPGQSDSPSPVPKSEGPGAPSNCFEEITGTGAPSDSGEEQGQQKNGPRLDGRSGPLIVAPGLITPWG